MLSNVFNQAHTEAQTRNLYRSMAKIFISLAKIPQPRIGSWTINNDGQLTLSNRPLFCHLQRLEGWDIPSGIARDTTYASADSLYLDFIKEMPSSVKMTPATRLLTWYLCGRVWPSSLIDPFAMDHS